MNMHSPGWLPVIVGFGLISLTLLSVLLFPRTWWARELLRTYGLRPTGEQGQYLRRDFLRGSLLASGVSVVLIALAVLAGLLGERYPNGSTWNNIGMVYLFGCTILGAMAAISSLQLLWRAIRWKSVLDERSHSDHAA